MTNQTPQDRRPPFAAYGPASAGYGQTATVSTPPPPGATAPWPSPQAAPTHPPGFVPAPGSAGPRPPRRGLGIVALVIACAGALFAFSASPLVWLLLVTALVLAIVQVARRGSARVPAVVAIVIVVLGIIIAMGAAILSGLTSSASTADPDPETDTYTLAQRLSVAPGRGSPSELAWGTAQTIVDSDSGDDVWSIRALAPVDITAEAGSASPAPFSASGSLVAVPIELTNLTDESIDPDGWQLRFSSSYLSPEGNYLESVYDPSVTDAYPSRYDIPGPIAPGETVTFYLVEDTPFAGADRGSVEVGLYSGDIITWRTTGG